MPARSPFFSHRHTHTADYTIGNGIVQQLFMHLKNYYSAVYAMHRFQCVNKIKSDSGKKSRKGGGEEKKAVKSSCIACISIPFSLNVECVFPLKR